MPGRRGDAQGLPKLRRQKKKRGAKDKYNGRNLCELAHSRLPCIKEGSRRKNRKTKLLERSSETTQRPRECLPRAVDMFHLGGHGRDPFARAGGRNEER